jgi:hypothetical protein
MGRLLAASAALVVVLAACGSGSAGKSSSTTASTAAASSSSTSSTTAPPATCVAGGSTGPFTAAGSATSLMTDVVTAAAGCADTVTFTFRPGPAPGYDVSYKPGPFQDAGSGNPHPVSGNAFVVVRFHPAAIADFAQPSAPLTYTGPRSIHPTGVAHVQDLEMTEAFEGYVTWVIGLDAQRPMKAVASASPTSLVITLG